MLQLVYRFAYLRDVRLVNFQLGNKMKKMWCLSRQECKQRKKNPSLRHKSNPWPTHKPVGCFGRSWSPLCTLREYHGLDQANIRTANNQNALTFKGHWKHRQPKLTMRVTCGTILRNVKMAVNIKDLYGNQAIDSRR